MAHLHGVTRPDLAEVRHQGGRLEQGPVGHWIGPPGPDHPMAAGQIPHMQPVVVAPGHLKGELVIVPGPAAHQDLQTIAGGEPVVRQPRRAGRAPAARLASAGWRTQRLHLAQQLRLIRSGL